MKGNRLKISLTAAYIWFLRTEEMANVEEVKRSYVNLKLIRISNLNWKTDRPTILSIRQESS